MIALLLALGCGSTDYYSVPVQVPVLLSPDAPFQGIDMAVSASEVKESRCEAALLVSGEVFNGCPEPVIVEAWDLDGPAGDTLPDDALRLDTLEVPGTPGAGSMYLSVDGLFQDLPADLHMGLSLEGSCAPSGVLDVVGQVSCRQGEKEYAVVTVTPIQP